MKARLMIWLMTVGAELQWRAGLLGHLTTDPACREYRRPRPGSRLDRLSRGWSCDECMTRRAFGWRDVVDEIVARTPQHDEFCNRYETGGGCDCYLSMDRENGDQ